MKQERIYNKVVEKVKEERIIETRYGITEIPEGEPLFTTSQETDVWEMVRDGMNVEEIVSIIRQW